MSLVSPPHTSVYFDHAATSRPKPAQVPLAMFQYLTECGVSYGRSTGAQADLVRMTVDRLRDQLAELLGADREEVVLTTGATDGLNLAIHGLMVQRGIRPTANRLTSDCPSAGSAAGDSGAEPALVLVTPFEHNAVLRPLQAWAQRGMVRLEFLPVDQAGQLDFAACRHQIQQRPWLVCVNHASNVTGQLQPVAAIGDLCRQAGTWFLVDAAQTLGWLPVDVGQLSCDILVAAGHKALQGPLGTGVLYVRRTIQAEIASLRLGGLGAGNAEWGSEPAGPAKWEAGNLNVPGLVGLAAALQNSSDPGRLMNWRELATRRWSVVDFQTAATARLAAARRLCSRLWMGLVNLPGVHCVAYDESDPFVGPTARLPILSLTVDGWEPAEMAVAMESAGGFITRAGQHCAPSVHSILGTESGGTWRISLGPDNSAAEVDRFLETLKAICQC